jgi:hypothetical protein
MSQFHDCRIREIKFDFDNAQLALSMIYPPDGNVLRVKFDGFIAAYLEDLVCGCVVFDIETISADAVLDQHRSTFSSRKNYGWPLAYRDDEDLRTKLGECVISQITSSYGLSGFIVSRHAPIAEHD